MQILNLINQNLSDISYTITRFPDGELHITLGEFSHKDYIEVACRITNEKDLFLLMQVADIINRHEVRWNLNIYYLMGMRIDRVMDFNRPFTAKIVCNIIDSLNPNLVSIVDPHSEEYGYLLKSASKAPIENEQYKALHPYWNIVFKNYLVVFPDKGAYKRYGPREGHVVANKIRNITTGKIEKIEIINPDLFSNNSKPIMVVDDLCDAGGTFIGLAEEIRKYTDKEINIFVTHMVNSKGIENLSKNYHNVYFTNSYCDWKQSYEVNGLRFPKNITQINII